MHAEGIKPRRQEQGPGTLTKLKKGEIVEVAPRIRERGGGSEQVVFNKTAWSRMCKGVAKRLSIH